MSLLCSLPVSLGRWILSTCVTATALVALDTAHCNHAERNTFLEILAHAEIDDVDAHCTLYIEEFYCKLEWIVEKRIKCASFTYRYKEPLSAQEGATVAAFFESQRRSLSSVHICTCDKSLQTFVRLLVDQQSPLQALDIAASGRVPPWDPTLSGVLIKCAGSLKKLILNVAVPVLMHMNNAIRFPALTEMQIGADSDECLLNILRAAPNLVNLSLLDPEYSDVSLSAMGQLCPHLKVLSIGRDHDDFGSNVDAGYEALMMRLGHQLKKLIIQNCPEFSDACLHAVALHCTQLVELAVQFTEVITDAPLIALAGSAVAQTLQSIAVDGCFQVRGTGIIALAKHCPMLHTLDLGAMELHPGSNETNIIPLLSNVRNLDLSMGRVDDQLLVLIADNMPSLEQLDIMPDGQRAYTLVGLKYVVGKCQHLNMLRLGCRQIDLKQSLAALGVPEKLRIVAY